MGGAQAEQWDRRRLLRTLVAIVAGRPGPAGRAGVCRGEHDHLDAPRDRPAAQPATAAQLIQAMPSGATRRDTIAAAEMLQVPPQAGRGGTPAAVPAPAMTIPPAGRAGPADVPTGYPHTPEGAIGQLAAIEVAVLQQHVHRPRLRDPPRLGRCPARRRPRRGS